MPKQYVIAGASSGIGFSLARRLSSGGHQVHALSRQAGQLQDLSGIEFHSWDALRGETPPLPDHIDGLCYCPGSIDLRPLGRFTAEDWLLAFQLNVLGAVRLLRAAYPRLRKSAEASVVLFSTVAVKQGMPFHSLVSTVKGGIEGLARSLAAEWAPSIRVNVIAPSLTDTPLAERLLANETRRRSSEEMHPLKRIGQADDQARAAAFLLSADSSWITGQVLGVDGGLSSLRV